MGIESIWETFKNKKLELFGKESASCAIFIFSCLIFRCLVVVLELEAIIPPGVTFTLPFIIQSLSRCVSLVGEHVPLLQVRLAEAMLGRIKLYELNFIISAHFFGSLLGAVCFQLFCPLEYLQRKVLLLPVDPNPKLLSGIIEAVVTCPLVIMILVVPEILRVNRQSKYLLNILYIPIYLISLFHPSCLSPAISFTLWYVNGSTASFRLDLFLGSIIGAIAAGWIVLKYFPDDNSSWNRKSKVI